jgi:hypothetical protein
LLAPHFAHGHEMSFRIRRLNAVAIKSPKSPEKSEQMLTS